MSSWHKPPLDVGFRCGHLQVVGPALPVLKDGHLHMASTVKCDCGNTIIAINSRLRKGVHRYCGKQCALRNKKHGDSHERLYHIWQGILHRCKPGLNQSKDYYDRGIRVCSEWKNYENFKSWSLSHGYSNDLSIDRIDNNGNYNPSNCRWANPKQQSANRRVSINITYNGETKNLSEWARIFGIKRNTLRLRIVVNGMTPEEAFKKGK